MKLLVCTPEYFPNGSGIANVAYNIVEQLKKQSIECTVCSPTGPDIRLGSQKLIDKCGIIGVLYFYYQVSKYFAKNNYDVIWFHSPMLIKKIDLRKVVVTIHSTYYGESSIDISPLYYLHLYKKISSIIEKYCLNNLNSDTKITVVSPNVRNELANFGFDISRIPVLPNGVNINNFSYSKNKFEFREKFGIPKDNTVLLCVGRLTMHKQPLELIDLLIQLEQKMNNITLCIAGKGELFNKIKSLIKDKNLDQILLLGFVSQADLSILYNCADYYIMPSKYEGGMPPLTLAEAMASGLPCIVADTSNLGIVEVADCGIIVNFEEKERAVDEIFEFISKDNSDHAKNARKYAEQFLNWEIISKQYLKIFQTIQDSNKSTL
jgi:1,2-diacylglycerol 3-alpha-glucosyltransferase